MSHDGCLEVAWKGQAFPYLLHKPQPADSYANRRSEGPQHTSGEDRKRAATGTWDGPAPRGNLPPSAVPPTLVAKTPEAQSVLLSSGYRMPFVGLGTYKITDPAVIRTALDVGYRHFDCASSYGNEAVVGEGLKEFIAAGKRNELFISSKLWNDAHRPDDVRASCLKSISQLGCTYLDLYLVHWPEAWLPGSVSRDGPVHEDTEVTLQQTWEAMQQLVDDGLVRSIGVSNFSLKQVEDILAGARIKPCVNQVELQPLLAQRKLLGVCLRKGVQCVAYAPLGHDKPDLMANDTVVKIAKELEKTPAQVLLRWNVQRGIPVLPKASSQEHLKDNLEVFDWVLTNEQKAALDALDCAKRFVDFPWKNWGNPEEGGAAKPSQLF